MHKTPFFNKGRFSTRTYYNIMRMFSADIAVFLDTCKFL